MNDGARPAPDPGLVAAGAGRAHRRVWPALAGALALVLACWLGYQVVTWPDVAALARQNPRTTAFIEQYRRSQRARGRPDAARWNWVSYERISPRLKRAVVSAEDMEFFFHHGFSSTELTHALGEALRRFQAPRGASTITQQLAKNLWLSPSRDPFRKLKEAVLTRQLERHLTKRRILELYLNVVELGPGIYGAEAAAEYYFGKPAADLTEHQAAELAASLPRPATWHPGRDSDSYRHYVAEVERRMAVATFLWRAVGAQPPVREVALSTDSLLRLLSDTAGLPLADTLAEAADTATTTAVPVDQDSALAVAAALSAWRAAYPGPAARGMMVAGFTRDSLGFLVDLVPAVFADSVAGGRGGMVRVGSDWTASVERLHR
jgi:monofunctional biosynthetic peptidoglycan transglycosylase